MVVDGLYKYPSVIGGGVDSIITLMEFTFDRDKAKAPHHL